MNARRRRWAGGGTPLALALAVASAVVAAGGCLDDQLDPNDPGAGTGFIALERDFQPFQTWTRLQVADAEVVGGHAAGPRFAYLSRTPVAGAFPVGTMIVKTTEVGDPQNWTIHAKAKRGSGFNPRGTLGWEWFDLRFAVTGEPKIMWRGEKPPVDHGYESLPGLGTTSAMESDCNSCHGVARDQDYVLAAPVLELLAQ